MANLKLNKNSRRRVNIEVEIEDKKLSFEYFEQNGKQKKEMRKLLKNKSTLMVEIDEKSEQIFLENLKGKEADKKALIAFYDEYGDISDLVQVCNEEMGKLKKKERLDSIVGQNKTEEEMGA